MPNELPKPEIPNLGEEERQDEAKMIIDGIARLERASDRGSYSFFSFAVLDVSQECNVPVEDVVHALNTLHSEKIAGWCRQLLEILESQSSPAESSHHGMSEDKIVSAFIKTLQETPLPNRAAERAAVRKAKLERNWTLLKENVIDILATNPVIEGGEALYNDVVPGIARKFNVSEEDVSLILTRENQKEFDMVMKKLGPAFEARLDDFCTTLSKAFSDRHDRMELETLQIMGVTDIQTLIDQWPVSDEQKSEWKKLLSFSVPLNAKLQAIPIIGGEGLDMHNELPYFTKGVTSGRDPKLVRVSKPIDNLTLTKNEILNHLKAEAKSDAEYVIVYVSTHGYTRSLSKPGVEVFGFTKVNASDDLFHIQNTVGTKAVRKLLGKGVFIQQANTIAEQWLAAHPQFFMEADTGRPRVALADQVITVGDSNIQLGAPVANKTELSERIAKYLEYKTLSDSSVSTADLAAVQKEASEQQPGKKFIYILDSCFSGSAIDDQPLLDLPNTVAIFAAATEEEFSFSDSSSNTSSHPRYGRGRYMDAYFGNLGRIPEHWGEAHIRSDMEMNVGAKNGFDDPSRQNPRAMIRIDGKPLKVSTLSHDKMFRNRTHVAQRLV